MSSRPLLQLLQAPWAIAPEKLAEIQAVYAMHVRGEVVDVAAVEARLGRPLASEQQSYTVNADGVAVLEANGVMAPKANLFMQISGGVSTQMFTAQLNSMRADARVRSAAIVWDSPGGQVLGIPAAAAALAALAEAKPTVSLARGVMASAAYWVGSAANAVLIEGATDVVGSLGVIRRLSWDEAQPNTLDLVRGKYKMASVNGAPPSAEYIADAEAQLDYLYTVLVNAVASHRGVSADAVLQHMAEGRLFTGEQAIQAGLADGTSTLDELLATLADKPDTYRKRRTARMAVAGAHHPPQPAGALMPPAETQAALSREAIERDHPALFAQLRDEFTTAGANAERARIQAVRAQGMPGHEALIETLAFDGHTTGPEAAMAVLAAERAVRAEFVVGLAADTPPPLAATATATGELPEDQAQAPAVHPMAKARGLADAIVAKQAEAKAAGRTLSAPQALALITKENSHG